MKESLETAEKTFLVMSFKNQWKIQILSNWVSEIQSELSFLLLSKGGRKWLKKPLIPDTDERLQFEIQTIPDSCK